MQVFFGTWLQNKYLKVLSQAINNLYMLILLKIQFNFRRNMSVSLQNLIKYNND